MRVNALYFGGLRAKLGREGDWLQLSEGSSVVDAAAQAVGHLGPEWMAALRYAVNAEIVPAATPLHEGDELALLPPVSGG